MSHILAALRRPHLFFPLESHCEQLKNIAIRQERLRAGARLRLSDTFASELWMEVELARFRGRFRTFGSMPPASTVCCSALTNLNMSCRLPTSVRHVSRQACQGVAILPWWSKKQACTYLSPTSSPTVITSSWSLALLISYLHR